MNLPEDVDIPFFAYGLFKPGELCYYRIEELVKIHQKSEVSGSLMERDGVPLLKLGENCSKIRGELITFHPEKCKDAYERIMDIEPKRIYKWEKTIVEGQEVNVLVGRRINRGSTPLEHVYEWSGMDDPYFSVALEEVEAILNENSGFKWNYKHLFRLQMAYMLLWTAIERYASLRYGFGLKPEEKQLKIAEETIFKESLNKHVENKRTVFDTRDPRKKQTLNPEDPVSSINYYYQVRSNAVHRGKVVVRDFTIIKSSLIELLTIFKDVLEDSWKYNH